MKKIDSMKLLFFDCIRLIIQKENNLCQKHTEKNQKKF